MASVELMPDFESSNAHRWTGDHSFFNRRPPASALLHCDTTPG